MKKQTSVAFPLVAIFVTAIMLGAPPIFAENADVTIVPTAGSGAPGCEETTDGCYIPSTATVDVGGLVIMSNTDTAAHTFTAGTASDGPSGEFDTGLIMAGGLFEYSPVAVGEIPYFCMVHPWMQGLIIVQEAGAEPTAKLVVSAPSTIETTVTGMSSDGKVRVEITSTNPTANESMLIDLKFRDSSSGGLIQHANYDIVATQNGKEILSFMGAHEHEGNGMHSTAPLASDDSVDIEVTLLGFGLPDDQANWTGPTGEIIYFNVVPEFGTIAAMILAVAIISIIAVSARSRLSIMPRL
ncbi:MAG: PEFG-CTERM sorting domain-containing protein [Nitrosopumilus sp.]|nr:PEFG-CTERM sorting domain-containing protein [Nitrosopumilus sp.]